MKIIMIRTYKDYTVRTQRILSPDNGNGWRATIFVGKDDGTKEGLRIIDDFSGRIKNHTQLVELAEKFIDAL